jgi:uncharacterized BrkB/YihY/UPF0761 family membrane protein
MTAADLVIPPPSPKLMDYPSTIGIGIGVVFTTILVIVSGKFDPTHGPLTISLMVVIAFMGVATFCMFFTVPSDEITSGVIGGLTAAFGAVVAHWLGKSHRNGGPP